MHAASPRPAPVSGNRLPHYEHPPLVEVALGVRWLFDGRIDDDVRQSFGERLGPSWEISRYSDENVEGLFQSWTRSAAAFHSVLRDQRLEVSSEGLTYAWDGRNGNIYPHYETVRDGFVIAFDAWQDTLAARGVAAPLLSSWSAAYLNCMPQGTVWNTLADMTFLRLLAPLPSGLPRLEGCEAHWRFGLERYAAALDCELRTTAGSQRDPRSCLWLRLTCRGGVTDDPGSLLEGLDFGRETIVHTFRQLMSPAANAYWELARDR